MLSNLFGKDNDMFMILILFFLLCGGCGEGGFGDDFLGEDNMLIWIILLFCLCGDKRRI